MKITEFLRISLLLFITSSLHQVFAQSPVSNWSYIEVDNEKSKWGDYDEPGWLRYFGLDMEDLNNDGFKD